MFCFIMHGSPKTSSPAAGFINVQPRTNDQWFAGAGAAMAAGTGAAAATDPMAVGVTKVELRTRDCCFNVEVNASLLATLSCAPAASKSAIV